MLQLPADRHCQKHGTMPVAVLGGDGDEVGLGHVGIAVAWTISSGIRLNDADPFS